MNLCNKHINYRLAESGNGCYGKVDIANDNCYYNTDDMGLTYIVYSVIKETKFFPTAGNTSHFFPCTLCLTLCKHGCIPKSGETKHSLTRKRVAYSNVIGDFMIHSTDAVM